MTTITTNGIKLLIVEVPEDAKDFSIVTSLRRNDVVDFLNSTLIYTFAKDHQGYEHLDGYPPKNLSLLGTITSGKVDFDCEEYVKEPDDLAGAYWNYLIEKYDFFDAWESFLSLLQSKGIEYKKCVVLRIN